MIVRKSKYAFHLHTSEMYACSGDCDARNETEWEAPPFCYRFPAENVHSVKLRRQLWSQSTDLIVIYSFSLYNIMFLC